MEKHQISWLQLVILLFVCRSFNLFTATLHDVGEEYGLIHMIAFLVAGIFQLLMVLPAWGLMKLTGRGLGEAASYTMGKPGVWFSILGTVYLLVTTSLTVYSMANFLVNAAFPDAEAVFFVVTLVLAAGYAASLGIEGIARAALIFCTALIIGLILVLIGVAGRIDIINVRPIVDEHPIQSVIRDAWIITGRSSPVFLYVMLASRTRNGAGKGFIWYLAATLVLQELVTFLIATVLGDLASEQAFPLFSLTTIARVSVFQRMDAVYLGLWVTVCFLRVAVSFRACKELLAPFLPEGKTSMRRKWILPFLMIAVACGASVLTRDQVLLRAVMDILSSGWPLVIVLIVGPGFMLIIGLLRGRLRKGAQQDAG